MRKIMKKILAITLSAVLFGGVAGGVFRVVTDFGSTADAERSTEQVAEKEQESVLQATTYQANTRDVQTLDVSEIVEGAMPSIVSITNKSVQEVQSYFSLFGRGMIQQQEVESSGSGIVIGQNDTELLLVTNYHVIENAVTISICFIDGNVYEATVKGTDADNDLAVVAVKLDDISEETMSAIKIAVMGDSEELKVGEQVVAIGNALGYGQSTTTGIVSALNRQLSDTESEFGFIQTDAAINPGNSGGALLNMKGELVGINSAKLASTEIEGMGYAIPLSAASPILENLMNRETREKVDENQAGSMGISGQTVDSTIAESYGIPKGVYVGEVQEGSAAQEAGVQPGMVITEFDGTSVKSIEELKEQLTYYAAGETVSLKVMIADNGTYVEKELMITLDHTQNTNEILRK